MTTYQEQWRPEDLKLLRGNDYQLRILHPPKLSLNNEGKQKQIQVNKGRHIHWESPALLRATESTSGRDQIPSDSNSNS